MLGTGDGGVYTTTADLARFWDALMGGRIVSEETLQAMVTPYSPPDEDGDCYGFGCWVREGSPAVTMIGSDAGVSFWSRHDPKHRTTATVVSNTSGGAWPLAGLLASIVDA